MATVRHDWRGRLFGGAKRAALGQITPFLKPAPGQATLGARVVRLPTLGKNERSLVASRLLNAFGLREGDIGV